jgi:tetratricopeptide (TPR) repeat protein
MGHTALRRNDYMLHLISLIFLLVVFSFPFPAYGQDSLQHGWSGTSNHDYFAAGHDPWKKRLLANIEANHYYSSPYHPRGVRGNIAAGKYEYAMGDLSYILERFPNHPKALQLLSSVGKLSMDLASPIPYYEKALRLFPQYAYTHAQYGAYLVEIGRIDMGMAKLNKAIEMDPDLGLAHAWLAKAYQKKGDQALARQTEDRARALGYREKLE